MPQPGNDRGAEARVELRQPTLTDGVPKQLRLRARDPQLVGTSLARQLRVECVRKRLLIGDDDPGRLRRRSSGTA